VARNIQVENNYFDGAWNKVESPRRSLLANAIADRRSQGSGGNGYVRGSRVWDSLYYKNTLRFVSWFFSKASKSLTATFAEIYDTSPSNGAHIHKL
jgi:hypothetical protein